MEKTRSLRKEAAALVAKGGRRPEMVADRTLCLLNAVCWGEDTSRGGEFAACNVSSKCSFSSD